MYTKAMLKLSKRCNVCKAVKNNKRMLNELYNSKFYMKSTGPSLLSISQTYPHLFSYESLKNHVRNHQFIDEDKAHETQINKIAKAHEQRILKRAVESHEVFDEVMNLGMEKLQAGEMNLKATDLIAAAKHKKEFQLKETDQKMAMMDMVYHFTSGENDDKIREPYDRTVLEGEKAADFNPAEVSTDDSERREAQSRSFYQRIVGDASSSRTD